VGTSEERRGEALPGGERERKELAATVGRPGYQLGHLEKSRGLFLGLNSPPVLDLRDLQNIQNFPKKTKYSK
jgi:hypothetical protein